jgi:tRNA pseudouridine55 synthase
MRGAPASGRSDDRPAPVLPPGGGLLLVDKPSGCTSHDVVGRLRFVLRTRRIGHAGTLDPMANGLLVLAVDRSTKLLGHLALTDKTYLATIRLGQRTDTDDADGDVVAAAPAGHLTDAEILDGITALTGPLMQVPSAVSAIKVDGRRAYDRVRAGETVELAARPVTIDRFEIVGPLRRSGELIDLDVEVECTTGTYVRSLARDLGSKLGVGGHLTRLRRTRVGPFDVAEAVDVFGAARVDPARADVMQDDAVTVDAARADAPEGAGASGEAAPHDPSTTRPRRRAAVARPPVTEEFAADIADRIVPAADAVRAAFAVRTVDDAFALDLQHGRTIPAAGLAGTYAVVDSAGDLVALVTESGGVARSVLGWRAAG